VIIAEGDGVDLAELAAKAGLSPASSAYCLEAFRGVTQALREAKMLASRPAGIVIYGCPLHCKRF
jgi:ABC-type amino acid transport system permease subunit